MIIFPDDVDMQIVSCIIGVCLVGGVSNLWVLILGGNFELSIVMSILNSLLVCGEFATITITVFDQNNLNSMFKHLQAPHISGYLY